MEDEKSKITAAAIEKMIDFYQGNLRDIEHFLKVWAYAKTIGEQESVDENTQGILELAAVVHDISCPLCREKYGNTNGKNQELESEPLVKEFFEGMPVSEQKVERIIWLVTHHHFHAFPDKQKAFHEIWRVLKPGGNFIACFYIRGKSQRTDWLV